MKEDNPYSRGARVWEEWYSRHPRDEAIPKELLPTEEQYKAWDRKEAEYVATHLKDYTTLLAYGDSVVGKPVEDTVREVIARTQSCRCREAQCSLFCPNYGMENCYGEENL